MSSATARQRSELHGLEIAARLKTRSATEPLRFVSQSHVRHRIGKGSFIGFLIAFFLFFADLHSIRVLDDQGSITVLDDQGSNSALIVWLTGTWAAHVSFVLMPVSVLFLVWLGTAYQNLLALGVEGQRYTSVRAVRVLLNPLINVFLAIRIVLDLWKVSGLAGHPDTARGLRLVAFWWTSVLGISVVLGCLGCGVLAFRADRVGGSRVRSICACSIANSPDRQ